MSGVAGAVFIILVCWGWRDQISEWLSKAIAEGIRRARPKVEVLGNGPHQEPRP